MGRDRRTGRDRRLVAGRHRAPRFPSLRRCVVHCLARGKKPRDQGEMSMFAKPRLFIPGPTPVPETVLTAMARPMINHRGKEFGTIFDDCTAGVKWLLQTEGDVFHLNGSGTA